MGYTVKSNDFDDAAVVRKAVFMDEQGYKVEFDAIDEDASCLHPVICVDGEPVCCARIFPEPLERAADPNAPTSPACDLDKGVSADATYILGRVAVLSAYRRRGLAREMVAIAENGAREAGAPLVKLHAQEYVISLYTKAGYTQIAPVDYEDEGQPHAWMAKLL